MLAGALLDAEAKMGELLKAIPYARDKQSSSKVTSLHSLPDGISKKQSHQFQQLANHPDIMIALAFYGIR